MEYPPSPNDNPLSNAGSVSLKHIRLTRRRMEVVTNPEFPLQLADPGSRQSDSASLNPSHPLYKRNSPVERRGEVVNGHIPNIIIFGESGVGKSSIINLIADQMLARTSNGALGCTFQHDQYYITLGMMPYAFWDTTGLDEGSAGTVPATQAESSLRELMQQLARSGGIHLIIYCIRSTRLTKALKRNYDLFYSTICRKKVPVALVVTGLEHQEGEMETWWTENEAALRRHGMRFDAHACVTTLDIEDPIIQQRRSASQTVLRDLIIEYSGLPAWTADPSFLPRVLPVFHGILRGTSSTGRRKVIVCGECPTKSLPGTTADWQNGKGNINDRQYKLLSVDKRALHALTPRASEKVRSAGAGLLIFYTSVQDDNCITLTDIYELKAFYDVAGGQTCPMIVVLWGCLDEEAVRVEVSSCFNDIRAYFVPAPSPDNVQAKLDEMIERLYVEQAKTRKVLSNRKHPGK